jgi:hypothetical protein
LCAHDQCCALEAQLRSRSCHCGSGKYSEGAALAEWRHHGSGTLCALPLTGVGSQPSACLCAAAGTAAAPCCNLQGSLLGCLGCPQLLKLRPKAERTPCRHTKHGCDGHSMLPLQSKSVNKHESPQPYPVLPAQLLLPAAGAQSPEPLCLCLLLVVRCKPGAACNQRQERPSSIAARSRDVCQIWIAQDTDNSTQPSLPCGASL